MTFGDGAVVGILVQTVDIHFDIMGNNKWYGTLFRLIAPKPIMDAFIGASSNLNNILLTGEDGTRCRINGVRARFREPTVAAQDMSFCEEMSVDIDEVIPLEKGPPHYEDLKEQTLIESSSVPEESKDSSGSEAKEGMGGKAGQDQGEDSPGGPTFSGDFMC